MGGSREFTSRSFASSPLECFKIFNNDRELTDTHESIVTTHTRKVGHHVWIPFGHGGEGFNLIF